MKLSTILARCSPELHVDNAEQLHRCKPRRASVVQSTRQTTVGLKLDLIAVLMRAMQLVAQTRFV
jgi:hypothetical protein